jgi:hypothetical protein
VCLFDDARDDIGFESIPPLCQLRTDVDPPVALEIGEVVLNRAATNAELDHDELFERSGGVLATGEHLNDSAADRFRHYLVRMHGHTVSVATSSRLRLGHH